MSGKNSGAVRQRTSVRDELERVLDESVSVDEFAHGLMSFLVDLSEREPGHPLIAALGEQLSRASTLPAIAEAMHDMRSILQGASMSLEYAPVLLRRSGVLAQTETEGVDAGRVGMLVEAIDDARAATRTAGELAREAFALHRETCGDNDNKGGTTTLNDAVETAARLAARQAPVDLQLETLAELEVAVPRSRLLRVIVNLLTNATHAIDELEDPEGARIRVSSWASDEFAFVQIDDDGPGIPEATLASVFELFFTTHAEGSGIGLHVCKTLVTAWGGRIRVDSREGEGARFTFSVPRARGPAI